MNEYIYHFNAFPIHFIPFLDNPLNFCFMWNKINYYPLIFALSRMHWHLLPHLTPLAKHSQYSFEHYVF